MLSRMWKRARSPTTRPRRMITLRNHSTAWMICAPLRKLARCCCWRQNQICARLRRVIRFINWYCARRDSRPRLSRCGIASKLAGEGARATSSFYEPVVFPQHFSQALVGQPDYFVIINPGHCFCCDHRVDDSFFRGLHGRQKYRVELLVGQHGYLMLLLRANRSSICGCKRNENVARAVAGVAAVSP